MERPSIFAALIEYWKGNRGLIASVAFSCVGAFLVGWAVRRYLARSVAIQPKLTQSEGKEKEKEKESGREKEKEKEREKEAPPPRGRFADQKERTLYEDTLQVFNTPPARLPIHVDLPRLARRIRVIGGTRPSDVSEEEHEEDVDAEQVKKDFLPYPVEGPTEEDRDRLRFQLLYRLISSVTRTLERGPFVEDFEEKLHAMLAEETGRGDVGMGLSYLFHETGAYETRMMRLFKAVQQRVIFAPAFAVKRKLTPLGLMTKDLHTPQAWRIFVDFTRCEEDIITVTHVRRECSHDQGKYFEVEWEFEMSFDEELTELRSADLRVTTLDFAKQFDSQLKKSIEDLLVNATWA